MKRLAILTTIGIFSLSMWTACGPNTRSEREKEKLEEAERDIKAEKEEWNAKLRDLGDRIDRRVEKLEAEWEDARDDRRSEIEDELDDLRARRKRVDNQVDRVGSEAKEDWNDAKREIQEAFDEIERAIKE